MNHNFPVNNAVLALAEFPACYTAHKNEYILPLWRFQQKVGAFELLLDLTLQMIPDHSFSCHM